MSPPFPAVLVRLEAVAASILQAIRTSVPAVQDLEVHFEASRGSMLRPGWFLACSDLLGAEPAQAALELAEMLELLHYASVLHDEGLARSGPGRRESILLGDLLLARAMTLLARHGDDLRVEKVARITADLSEGRILALELRTRPDSVPGDRLAARDRIASLRTGSFLGHAALLAASLGRELPHPVIASLETCGREAGAAYDLIDRLDTDEPGDGAPDLDRREVVALAAGHLDRAEAACRAIGPTRDAGAISSWLRGLRGTLEEP